MASERMDLRGLTSMTIVMSRIANVDTHVGGGYLLPNRPGRRPAGPPPARPPTLLHAPSRRADAPGQDLAS